MPLGFERLNERKQRPNANINFIKPIPPTSPSYTSAEDEKIARDFLERIAAQCYPVMKANYISVMALEEYPPNPEFLGRNFNAGEVVQLVLKNKHGQWLSFKFVQMVMMHELAHCKQMNHSRFFWQVRNQYADHMKEIWQKGYRGEGLWGRGRGLSSGQFEHDHAPAEGDVPERLCGGTYRRARGKKRKRGGQDADSADKSKLSYAERQQKRIAKKFGAHGEGASVGEDELLRGALEAKGGKRHQGKPRVAGSKRGRELRAQAALARFEAAKKAPKEETPELEEDYGSETELEDDVVSSNGEPDENNLVQVCGDEGENEDGGKEEMEELRSLTQPAKAKAKRTASPQHYGKATVPSAPLHADSETESEPEDDEPPKLSPSDAVIENEGPTKFKHRELDIDWHVKKPPESPGQKVERLTKEARLSCQYGRPVELTEDEELTALLPSKDEEEETGQPPASCSEDHTAPTSDPPNPTTSSPTSCPICSLENESDAVTCMACSNVLKPKLMSNAWRCKSEICKGSKYINVGDAGRCGLCGAQRAAGTSGASGAGSNAGGMRPVGVIGGDVLRWD